MIKKIPEKYLLFRIIASVGALVVCLALGLSVKDSLADTLWSEPPWSPGVNNVNPPVWNQASSPQTANFYITGSGRFDANNYGNAYCLPAGSKVCGADSGNIWGVVGESNGGYGLYGSSISSYGLYASSATSYAGYFAGPVYVNGDLSVEGKSVCLSDGTNCSPGGGYWTANVNDISNTNSGNVGIGISCPDYKLDVSGEIRATGALYANANGAPYLCGGDDACLHDVNLANTVGIYGEQDSTRAAIKLGSNGGVISGVDGAIKINDKDVCLSDGTNCISGGGSTLVRTDTNYASAPPATACSAEYGSQYSNATNILEVIANIQMPLGSSYSLDGWAAGSRYEVTGNTYGGISITPNYDATGVFCLRRSAHLRMTSAKYNTRPPKTACASEFGSSYKNTNFAELVANWPSHLAQGLNMTLGWITSSESGSTLYSIAGNAYGGVNTNTTSGSGPVVCTNIN